MTIDVCWTGEAIPEEEIPLDTTVAAMDAGGVSLGVLNAWHAPEGPMIANDEARDLFLEGNARRVFDL